MKRYQYSDAEQAVMEGSCIPFAVYQFVDKRVVTLAVSAGFCECFGFQDFREAYDIMDNDMYRDTYPDDAAIIEDEALRFATDGGEYDVLYRSKVGGEYNIIHARGKHIYKESGERLAVVWYSDEGRYRPDGESDGDELLRPVYRTLEARSRNRRLNYDYLTGLPSLSYFLELAEAGGKELQSDGKEPVMLFFDCCNGERRVSEVFERADEEMYRNKKRLKEGA